LPPHRCESEAELDQMQTEDDAILAPYDGVYEQRIEEGL